MKLVGNAIGRQRLQWFVRGWSGAAALSWGLLVPVWASEPAVPVQVMQLQQQRLAEPLQLSGTVKAVRQARLSVATGGLVATVLVDAGASVQAGQPLLQLDDALSRQQLAQAEAAVQVAKAAVAEQQRLVTEARQLSSQQLFPLTAVAERQSSLQRTQAELAVVQAQLAEQQVRLRQHLLRAPFSGVIKARWCETGEWLQPGQAVLELVEPNKLWLEVQVPQEKFSQVTAANRIEIQTDMQPELSLVGQIAALVPVSDSSARSFLLRLAFTDPAAVVQAGTSGRAILYLPSLQSGSLVPSDALVRHPDGSASVFIVENKQAVRHKVQIGRTTAAGVEILPALPAAATIVVRGNEQLQHQQPVVLVTAGEAPALTGAQ